MGATVDNLESHFRYRVIRGFTDAKGVRVPFEATGVIRMIAISDDYTEIRIDWERDGQPERLTFLLSATEGPRNGRMRDYFEKGEFVAPPRAPRKHVVVEYPPPPPQRPERPDIDLAPFAGRQPEQEISLKEVTVACACDPAFHRTVWPPAHLKVNACLQCGSVTVTKQVGDDGRHTGNAWVAYWTVPTPQHVVDWLGRFPRIFLDYSGAPSRWPMSAALVRYPALVYPAAARVVDRPGLDALEAQLSAEQADQSRAWRIAPHLMDIPAPPGDLPPAFDSFRSAQAAQRLRPESDPGILRAHAHLLSPTCELAADLLLRRPDAYGLMMDWLGSADDDIFGAGIAMLRDARRIFSGPDDPRLGPEVLRLMDKLPLGQRADVPMRVEGCLRFEAFLVAIADLGVSTPAMLEGLKGLARKVGGKDPYTVEAIRAVIRELGGV